MKIIKYKDGYKYQLAETYSVWVAIVPATAIRHNFISLSPLGFLSIRKGYAWDGPSGPTIDTKNFMRGSLVHVRSSAASGIAALAGVRADEGTAMGV